MAEWLEWAERLRARVSPPRYYHSLGVADTAVLLAARWGVDPERARLAGLLHDWARELTDEETAAVARRFGLPERAGGYRTALLHGPVAAALLREEMGFEDEVVLEAIELHTVGRPGMSRLARVVWLADSIEPTRSYPGVEELRRQACESLEEAMASALRSSIRFLRSQGALIEGDSLRLLAELEAGLGREAPVLH
ncbi:MAG: bis(5'-nucleosyl)-tetraphosphatase (symmetrical) YqeK [Clostridia bacterium]|nr:bis(5'-nucleosyl)-tetraphosphatase (symmetrical) YqeK [Clostridia bacterium]